MAAANPRDANPVKGEADFEYQGKRYRMVFDWEATVAYEAATDSSFIDLLVKIALAAEGGPSPRLHHLGEFMRCGLMRHHPEVDAETGAAMYLDRAVRQVAAKVAGLGMPEPDGEGSDRAAGEDPGESNGAARAAGSRRSSASGSRPEGKKKRSGVPRRG